MTTEHKLRAEIQGAGIAGNSVQLVLLSDSPFPPDVRKLFDQMARDCQDCAKMAQGSPEQTPGNDASAPDGSA